MKSNVYTKIYSCIFIAELFTIVQSSTQNPNVHQSMSGQTQCDKFTHGILFGNKNTKHTNIYIYMC